MLHSGYFYISTRISSTSGHHFCNNRNIKNFLIGVLKGVLEFCCGNKVNYTENFLDEKASVTDNGHTMMTSDILHPILSYTKQEQSHGHFFIPLLDAPVGYFYQHRPSTTKTTLKLILACLRLWPLGTICLMMALIAGFIVWATVSTRRDKFLTHLPV